MRSSNIKKRILRILATTAALLLIVVLFQLTGYAATFGTREAEAVSGPKPTDIKQQGGIEITSMRITASGYMIDFRYKVLNAEKAKPLFVRRTKPYLIDQTSGKKLSVAKLAKIGSLRNSNMPKQGRNYWMFFGNTQRLVKAGDKVTVVIGDFRVEDLTVE